MVCVGTLKSNCSLTPTVSLFFNSTPLPFPVILHAVSSITTLYVSFGHLIHAVVLYLTLPILVLPLPLLFLHLLSHRLELNGSHVDTLGTSGIRELYFTRDRAYRVFHHSGSSSSSSDRWSKCTWSFFVEVVTPILYGSATPIS
jgi:hypothetical protein